MKLIVCVDDAFGMLFNNRRQSRDRALCQDILELTRGSKLFMSPYSATLFKENDAVYADEAFLQIAAAEDYCFVETADISPYAREVRCVIVYHWNREYPADAYFPIALFADRWRLDSSMEFAGFSHERITREVYVL